MRIAQAVHAARMAPKGMDTPEQCMVAILHGLEVGLTPLAALQRIAVVNGRPTIWGDGALALVRASGLAERIVERIEGDGPVNWTAVCEVMRKGEAEPVIRTFSVEDAKRARLWGKAGPWTDYPRRMLQMRARAFALRDAFADVLGGLYLQEEIEEETRRIHVIAADVEPRNIDDEETTEAQHVPQTVPPLPPMRSLDLRRHLSKEASRLRFRNGWSIRQPKSLRPMTMAIAPDPRDTDALRAGDEDARRAGVGVARRAGDEDSLRAGNEDARRAGIGHALRAAEGDARRADATSTERDARRPPEPRTRGAYRVEPDDRRSLAQDGASVLDLFDDALACAQDTDTLSEIVEEFASRLNDLPRDVRLSADIVIARHEKRIAQDAGGGPNNGPPGMSEGGAP